MEITKQQIIHTDVLIIGGGTAGCYAALTIREKSDAKIIIAEKANIKRSGCLAAGVNAINAYIVKGRKPQDYVDYARKDADEIVRLEAGDTSIKAKSMVYTEGTDLENLPFLPSTRLWASGHNNRYVPNR